MKKVLIFIAAFTVSSTVFAADIYTCDGFKFDKEKDLREKIPNTKFEVQESEDFGIRISNKTKTKIWSAYEKIGNNLYKNGNYKIMKNVNKDGKPFFGYFNDATKQTVIFTNCEPKEDF